MTKEEEILVEIGKLNTKFDEIVKPAISQTYDNKDDIIRIIGFQKVMKYVGGMTIVTTVSIVGRMIYGFIIKHPPPPNIPH